MKAVRFSSTEVLFGVFRLSPFCSDSFITLHLLGDGEAVHSSAPFRISVPFINLAMVGQFVHPVIQCLQFPFISVPMW